VRSGAATEMVVCQRASARPAAWPVALKESGLASAVPGQGPVAEEGLRTIPPRENCGNADVKQLTRGSKLYVPVAVDGALYSVGDGHYAQGDSECCGTAIEMGATAEDLKLVIHPHPTLSESVMESAEVFFGQSTHVFKPKKK